jgi:hypothetical protein
VADRSIVIPMHRKRPIDQCERLRSLNPGIFPAAAAVSRNFIGSYRARQNLPKLPA